MDEKKDAAQGDWLDEVDIMKAYAGKPEQSPAVLKKAASPEEFRNLVELVEKIKKDVLPQ